MSGDDRSFRAVWLAIIVLASLMGAIVTGCVLRMSGACLSESLITGGGAFFSFATLCLSARKYLS
jgi:hypothetical protein